MSIVKYQVIKPVIDTKKPHVNKLGAFIVPNIKRFYTNYVEVKNYNDIDGYEYYLLLGISKFDSNCRKCRVDDYARLIVNLHDELKDYATKECNERGNLEFNYIESEDDYDVWQIV